MFFIPIGIAIEIGSGIEIVIGIGIEKEQNSSMPRMKPAIRGKKSQMDTKGSKERKTTGEAG